MAGKLRSALVLVLLLGTNALSLQALEVPPLRNRVNDLADLLSPEAEAGVETRLAGIEAASSAQVAVLTVPSLDGEDLEEYSLRVAETWRLGQAAEDNGALLLIARDDRKMRLEVGYGLEGVLTDALSRRILDEVIRPRFQDGDYAGGIEAGVEAIAAVVAGQSEAEALPPPAAPEHRDDAYPILLFMLVYLADITRSLLARRGPFGWIVLAAFAGFLGFVVFQFFGLPKAILAGLVALALLIPLRLWLGTAEWAKVAVSGRRRRAGCAGILLGPPIFGRGGSGRGGGSSGGGFRGGGGSFGGGGASSGW